MNTKRMCLSQTFLIPRGTRVTESKPHHTIVGSNKNGSKPQCLPISGRPPVLKYQSSSCIVHFYQQQHMEAALEMSLPNALCCGGASI